MRNSSFPMIGCLLFLILLLWGCATIYSDSTQELYFQSSPDGVSVIMNGQILGKTPLATTLQKKSRQSLEFKKDGYQTIHLKLSTELNGWFWVNILSPLGSTTDVLSGAAYEYSPNQYFVVLPPLNVGGLEFHSNYNKAKVKDFIISAYRNLMIDLDAGRGEYLTSLLELLKIASSSRKEAIQKIRKIGEQNSNIPEFADQVISEYMK